MSGPLTTSGFPKHIYSYLFFIYSKKCGLLLSSSDAEVLRYDLFLVRFQSGRCRSSSAFARLVTRTFQSSAEVSQLWTEYDADGNGSAISAFRSSIGEPASCESTHAALSGRLYAAWLPGSLACSRKNHNYFSQVGFKFFNRSDPHTGTLQISADSEKRRMRQIFHDIS